LASPTPLTLGFDTSAAHCAAALLRDGEIVASAFEEMKRGQAERLMPLLEEVLQAGGASWAALDRIGVGIGPGNFTGIRISVSAARGLALGLNIPAIGVSGFDALAAPGTLTAIAAPREQVYISPPGEDGRLVPVAQARDTAAALQLTLRADHDLSGIAASVARCAAARNPEGISAPAPLYIRPADAAPSRDVPPTLLDS
jgi:tRNA A37 threonylcarbamoyladenosine modification protein TsaB